MLSGSLRFNTIEGSSAPLDEWLCDAVNQYSIWRKASVKTSLRSLARSSLDDASESGPGDGRASAKGVCFLANQYLQE